jgi:hypothetical protein
MIDKPLLVDVQELLGSERLELRAGREKDSRPL